MKLEEKMKEVLGSTPFTNIYKIGLRKDGEGRDSIPQ